MSYSINWHAIDGTDGDVIESNFGTIEAARDWAVKYINLDEYKADALDIRDESTDEQVEILNEIQRQV